MGQVVFLARLFEQPKLRWPLPYPRVKPSTCQKTGIDPLTSFFLMRFFQDLPKRTEKNSPKQQSGEDSNRYVWWYFFLNDLLSKKMSSKKNALEIHGFFQELSNRTCFGFGSVVPWNRTDPEWNRTVKPNRTEPNRGHTVFFQLKFKFWAYRHTMLYIFFWTNPYIFKSRGTPNSSRVGSLQMSQKGWYPKWQLDLLKNNHDKPQIIHKIWILP